MASILRKLLTLRNRFDKPELDPDEIIEEKWVADFSRQSHVRFEIKSESSYDANLRKNLSSSRHSLVLALKKSGCMAWVEAPDHRYRDIQISGAVRIDAKGGYGAGGMLFRMVDEGTYYSFLISNRGYFRLDAMRNGMPFPLVGWTEIPLFSKTPPAPDKSVDFSILASGSNIIIFIQGQWAAEANDSSIAEGTIGFTVVSYEGKASASGTSYMAEAFLESLTVDSRLEEVAELYEKWRDNPDIDAGARLRLAETFVAINQHSAAMTQLHKGWNRPGHKKNQRELLLAGRIAQALGRVTEAENYIGQCFQINVESPEGKEALTDMAKILYTGERFKELKDYCTEALKLKSDDPVIWTFQGHAYWNLKKNKEAAAAYNRAFELDQQNGILAKNAANVYDVMGRPKEALKLYLEAGRIFLNTGNYNDLGLLVPILLSLGENNQEARSLAGKWAFAVEDWNMANKEFKLAEELRNAMRPKPKRDGAQVFLEALLLIRAGKRRAALPLLKEAVSLEKNYALFHFRLAETLFLLDDNPDDPQILEEMNTALSLLQEDEPGGEISAKKENDGLAGWVNNFAAQITLRKGDLDAAAKYLEKAMDVLGDLPAVRVNRAVLFHLRGSLDKALDLLKGDRQDDPEGIMANCAGNLLVQSGRFEDADEKYRKALSISPDNVEYLCNRSSCLIELALYGEADELLAKAHTIAPSPALLEMISFVAVKKGEYPRAEQACRSALEIDPRHAPSLISLGWILLTMGKDEEAREMVQQLEKLELRKDTAKSLEELQSRLYEQLHRVIECASCAQTWRVQKNPPPARSLRFYAMPPDNLPAGSCAKCGKTYCIGCAKKNLEPSSGRFICPACNCALKLVNEGLKEIVNEWAAKDGLVRNGKPEKTEPTAKPQGGRGRPRKAQEASVTPPEPPAKTSGRGRPRKVQEASVTPPEPPAKTQSGRGRPRKAQEAPVTLPEPPAKTQSGRGRPRKAQEASVTPPEPPAKPQGGRGRPRKVQEASVTSPEPPAKPQSRGRLRKAEQASVTPPEPPAKTSGRGRPRKTQEAPPVEPTAKRGRPRKTGK